MEFVVLESGHYGMGELVAGDIVDVSTWSPRAIRRAVDQGVIYPLITAGIATQVAVQSAINEAVIDGGNATTP